MNKKGQAGSVIFILLLMGAIILFFIFFVDGIDKVLDKECEKEGMEYVYYRGTNCIDENNVLHPFVYDDCSILVWNDNCEIRFINPRKGETE